VILNAAADTRAGAARRNALNALSVASLIVPSAETNAMQASTVSPRLPIYSPIGFLGLSATRPRAHSRVDAGRIAI